MSCFVVDKAGMARAAGIVAGIADAANAGNQIDRFWMYDAQNRRNMTGTDFLDKFMKVYEMNVKSVSESWGEKLECDQADYTSEFNRAAKLGKKAYLSRWENGAYLRIIQELQNFFDSVRYQIDNPELEKKAVSFLNAITVRLMKQLDTGEHDSWGSFDLATVGQIMTEEETTVKLHIMRALKI